MMIITVKSFKKLFEALSTPLFGLAFAIVLTVVAYLISISEKSPSYYVSQEYRIANCENLNDDFSFYWKQKKLNQINQVYLTLWNDGNDYIDYSDFTSTSPILLKSDSVKVDIHNVSVVEKSRVNINVRTEIVFLDSIECIRFKFIGDDALENNDGVKVRITYSSELPADWILSGRVKGAKNRIGFERVDVTNDNKSDFTNVTSIILFFILIFRLIVSYLKMKAFVLKSWEIVFIITYIIYLYVLPYIFGVSRDFNWLQVG